MGKRGDRTIFQYIQKVGKWQPVGDNPKRQGCPGEWVFSKVLPSSKG